MSRKHVLVNEIRGQFCPACPKNFEYFPNPIKGCGKLVRHLAMADNIYSKGNKSLDANPHARWRKERGLPLGYEDAKEVGMMMKNIRELPELQEIYNKMKTTTEKDEN